MRASIVPLAAWLLFVSVAVAQSQNATVTGRVVDPSNAVISTARVEVINLETNAKFTSETNGEGVYRVSSLAPGMWTVDQIPAERLVAPLVVVDVRAKVKGNPDYQVSVEDIAAWERENGDMPLGAVVMARTGWDSRWNLAKSYRNADGKGVMHFPGYSEEAARFLAEGRNTLGLGIDTPSLHHGSAKNLSVNQYTSAHGLYVLTNVANLDRMPANGAIAMVAPMKVTGGSAAPVRILALVK